MYQGSSLYEQASAHSMHNKETIKNSMRVGCYYCLRTYAAHAINITRNCITHFNRDGVEHTVFCPLCGIDALIGDASGYEITPEFLSYMHSHGFGTPS